ncbi:MULTISPECIES: PTS transporter subunit IIC [Peptoniphilus]|uniref:PTS transporter subunit IIC n=1 Tax=Peptoniphilus TaxID=162289 RepID=UPI000288AB25|nr:MULTISPECIES: PTS sugar transporter subunit IIC [Peptoniphilus]MDU1043364.1 PTS sugar transporter subunit IIC [Peptoniphilus rhinitidis]MDU2110560.1 PTS sugar transporter subunit IIC [Peptoniphilus lacydonensis]MDU2115319.1 PTS sugar transporter subunit IIC [Peptoniphilus lacydonensis]MDU3750279.1 PTS sugar transporter subunit IIC [Peptoniphilus rhinitidis]MDU7301884.1 PTS sugar transporter subunit IIC [Peptoniphilus lacydonensis]
MTKESFNEKLKKKSKLYFIDALGAMAFGLFATLLVGTILNTIGKTFNISFLSEVLWPLAQKATGPAIAVAIASSMSAPSLVVYASTVVGIAGNELGGPMGVYIATIFAVEFGKLVSKKTKIDIIVTPVVTVLVGVFIANFVGPYISAFMNFLGLIIMNATEKAPFFMGIIVSVIVGIVLTLPISSAALCMMLSLSSLAGGAATIGCCCQMIGFAVMSYRDNKMEGLVAQGLGTSMLQMPNIVRKPIIILPPIISSAILGPVSTIIFKLENTPLGSGMGTSGLVGQISTFTAMPQVPFTKLLGIVILMHIILPAILTFSIYEIFYRKGLIQDGDMKLYFN